MNAAGLSTATVTDPGYKMRTFLWSVRRELWENRSLWLAPFIVGIVEVIGFSFSAIGLPERRRGVLLLSLAEQRARIEEPYSAVAMMMMFIAFVVGIFYCADALQGERRDRTILFWKSLPVSDSTTVLAKATVPLVVLPLIACAVTICVQLTMLAITDLLLLASGVPLTRPAQLPLTFDWLTLFYGLVAISAWHAPIYSWLLLVSGWVRRASLLWAVLPVIAVGVFEKITFGTNYVGAMVKYRLLGFAPGAFEFQPHHGTTITSLAQFTPGRYLATPGLWLGLLFAGVCCGAAIRLRRYNSSL